MKTKGAKICLGLLLLASWVLLVPNGSFAGDRDNDSFWAPVMQTNYDKGNDWGRSDSTPNWFNPPRHIFSYGGRDRDQDGNQDGGNHYGWDGGNHYHHPSPCK